MSLWKENKEEPKRAAVKGHGQKTRTIPVNDVQCRLCNKVPQSVAHVLSGCSALAQNKYT